MPSMNSGKYELSLVVVKNKLFVISKIEDYCEVFDNICKKFITLQSPQFNWFSINSAFSIENKIFVLHENHSKKNSYDTNKNE